MAHESRAESRARIEREIVEAGRRQLGEVGAAGLSLREVAREIGMVSSAVYRYVASRDELLTRLIIEAYDELGSAAEDAAASHTDVGDLDRWTATATAIRRWAFDHPHDYLLLFGSPVPGYAAPETTVASGTRATRALVGVIVDAHATGRLAPPSTEGATVPETLAVELGRLGTNEAGGLDAETVAAFVAAWTQLYGLISFEITNQTRGFVTETDALFEVTVRRLAHRIG
ncbi:MAG: TetR/AcrR family transcriptional regulator, partial [Ilumatobacter sp.]|nr:TetR/AcrR family transcriptional regulator [Ilumatobacter sp.]